MKMNTSLSALLLWENESRYRSGTFRSYKQLVQEITEISQRKPEEQREEITEHQ